MATCATLSNRQPRILCSDTNPLPTQARTTRAFLFLLAWPTLATLVVVVVVLATARPRW